MVVSNSDEVLLNMNITGREFAKAKLMQYLNSPGYLVSYLTDGSCAFSTWCFTGTKEMEDTMYMTGSSFEGTTLHSILTDSAYADKRFDVFEKIRNAVEQSIDKNITLPLSGPCGTIIGSDGSLLFLPQEYIQRSVSALHESDSSSIYGCYFRPGLNHTDSLRFMLTVYTYEIITGRLPFPKKNEEERLEDYMDHNFIPVKYWNTHVSEIFSNLLSHNLSISTDIKKVNKKNRPQIHEQIQEIKTKALPPLDLTIKQSETLNIHDNENESAQDRIKFTSSLSQKVRIKRFFRKKGTLIKIAAAVTAVILTASISLINENKDRPTTIGLTPYEVVESFYTSLNMLDVTLASSTTKKSTDDGYKDMISSFYVINKMRSAYDSSSQTLHPAQWLYTNRDFADWMYGITQLKIDSISADAFSKHYKPEVKREPIQEQQGAKTSLAVSYYLIRHEGDNELVVTECNEVADLEFIKNRWLISGITSNNREQILDADAFNKEYASFDSTLDVYSKADSLSKKYPWIPSDKEIKTAIEELKAIYEQYTF